MADEEMSLAQERVRKINRIYSEAKENRRKHDWEWLVRQLFYRGYHFAQYNRSTSTLTFANRSGVRIPINLLWAHARAVRNQVTAFRPKWEVMPFTMTESAESNALYSNKVLDYIYEKSHIKRAIKELITQGLLYSIGIWQFDVGQDGRIFVRSVDPYDLYVDPNIRSADINDPDFGASYVIQTVNRPLEAVKNDPRYENTDQIEGGDNRLASAEYKQFLMQVTHHQYQSNKPEYPTKEIKIAHTREYQDDGTFKIRVTHTTDGVDLPLLDELTDEIEYPWEIYQGDLSPLELYGESWAKHLIPVNRVMDALEAHIFEYNHIFARGRYVVDKNSGVRLIVNQHGQIIEKNRGATVTSLPISPLPVTPESQILRFRTYFEDLSGAHDVSLGRIPTGVKSGVAIDQLRQADATNQDDLVDNLEDFLARAGRRVLKLVAHNWTTAKLVQTTGIGGKPEYFMAVGNRGEIAKEKKRKYKLGEKELPLAVIGDENEVQVKVGSWLAYTKMARQEQLKELYRLGAIDQKTLLEHLRFPDIDDISRRTREEALLQMRGSQSSEAVERQTGVQMTDEELALAENELMLEGKDVPVEAADDHEVHVILHREALDEDTGGVIKAHINEHINMMRFLRQVRSQPLPPEEEGGAPGQPITVNGQGGISPLRTPGGASPLTTPFRGT